MLKPPCCMPPLPKACARPCAALEPTPTPLHGLGHESGWGLSSEQQAVWTSRPTGRSGLGGEGLGAC